MIAPERPRLSLAQLEAFDPHSSGAGAERRFDCPLPACADKPQDRAHQSLCLNTGSGLWTCFRCGARGQLVEHWAARPTSAREVREARRQAALRAIRIPPERQPGTAASAPLLPELVKRCVPLAGTPGQRYLFDRGVGLGPAQRAGVTYCASVYRRPAVVFPMGDRTGQLLAVNCRHTDGRDDPKTHSVGDRSLAVFLAAPGVLESGRPLVVCEGPLDALSLTECGVDAIALVATVAPRWLAPALAFRTVYAGLDADPAGDAKAPALVEELRPFARTVERLRPPGGVKDWNDALLGDYGGLCAFLEERTSGR